MRTPRGYIEEFLPRRKIAGAVAIGRGGMVDVANGYGVEPMGAGWQVT